MNKKSNPSIAAVVVTYNRKELLRECIDALMTQSVDHIRIYVVDNASTDGTHIYIEDYIEKGYIVYINTGSNLGGAGGFNMGMRAAVEDGHDYIWLMDDDTMAHPDTLSKLLDAAKKLDYNFGFLVSFPLFTDGSPSKMNLPDIKQPGWAEAHEYLEDGILAIERATFVSFLVPREIVLEVGLPIKEFFIWADDSEYSKRISGDHMCYLVNSSVITHKMQTNKGASENSFVIEDEEQRIDRFYYKFRNQHFIAKEEGRKEVWRYWYRFFRLNIQCLRAEKYRFKKIRVLWKGYWQGIFFHPPIEKI